MADENRQWDLQEVSLKREAQPRVWRTETYWAWRGRTASSSHATDVLNWGKNMLGVGGWAVEGTVGDVRLLPLSLNDKYVVQRMDAQSVPFP